MPIPTDRQPSVSQDEFNAVARGETAANAIDVSEPEPLPEKEPLGFWARLWKRLNPLSAIAKDDIQILRNTLSIERRLRYQSYDADLNPEVREVAHVRRGTELCAEETEFLAKRRLHTRDAFAKYIGVDPSEVHPDDVPVVGFGGSGGGFRAMLAVVGYCIEMKRAGLWDLVTYTAGVSGSCWAFAAYHTIGNCDWDEVLQHFKRRLHPYHPLSSEAIRAIMLAPGGMEMALGPLVQKDISGLHLAGMDFYSVYTSGHLWLHEKDQKPDLSLIHI